MLEVTERISFDNYDKLSLLVPRPIVFNSLTKYMFNEKGELISNIISVNETIKMKKISCGNCHSIATSIDGEMFIWGTCNIPINHLQSNTNTEDKIITVSPKSEKIEISKLLPSYPKDIQGAGNTTLVIL